jgi:hypothetical protein
MAIDASIASGNAPPNLLQSLLGATQVKGAMLQQQALTQQMGANKATSSAMQQAYDPATGKIDTNKLTAILSQDPAAAYNLPTVQGQILDQQNKQLEFDKNTYDLAVKRTQHLQNGLGSLMNKPDLSPQDIIELGSRAIKDGTATAEQTVRYLQGMPSDPSKLREWTQQKWIQSLSDDAQLRAMLPQTQVVNTGGQQQILNIDPLTGKPTLAAGLQNTMDPNTATAPVAAFDPRTGAPINMTREQFANQAGGAGQAPIPGAGGNGRYPGAGGAPQAAMPGQPVIGVQTGPALGQSAAAEAVGKGSGDQVLNLQSQAEGSPQRVYFMQDMLANLKNFESGPTADWTAKANALALQLAPGMAAKMGVDPEAVKSKEEFSKFATNLAINSTSGLGAGTDSKLAAAVAGNPNASLSKLGNEQIMKVLIGTERATQAKNLAWQNAGVGPEQYGKWSAQWNKDIDPRVFVTPELTQDERAKMFNGLKPAEQKSFLDSYRTAIDAGIIQRPAKQ